MNESSADFPSWLKCSFQYVTPERKVMSAKAHGVLILVLCSSECRAVRMWCRSVSARSSNTTRRFAWLLFRCTSWHSAPNKHRKSRWNTSSECLTFMCVSQLLKEWYRQLFKLYGVDFSFVFLWNTKQLFESSCSFFSERWLSNSLKDRNESSPYALYAV